MQSPEMPQFAHNANVRVSASHRQADCRATFTVAGVADPGTHPTGVNDPGYNQRSAITSPSPFTVNFTAAPSATVPAMSARANFVSMFRWRKRFNGRAPNTGS